MPLVNFLFDYIISVVVKPSAVHSVNLSYSGRRTKLEIQVKSNMGEKNENKNLAQLHKHDVVQHR